jgi:hypothetical protein
VHQLKLAPEWSPSRIDLLGCQDRTVLDRLTVGLKGASEIEEGANFDGLCGAGEVWHANGGNQG